MATRETTQDYPENHLTPENMDLETKTWQDSQSVEDYEAALYFPRDADFSSCEESHFVETRNEELLDEKEDSLEYFGNNCRIEFPEWILKLEQTIRKFRALGDDVKVSLEKTRMHNMVASSSVTVSRAANLLGLALTLFLGGMSLALTGAGQSGEAATGKINVATNLEEQSRNEKVKARADRLQPASDQGLKQEEAGKTSFFRVLAEFIPKIGNAMQDSEELKAGEREQLDEDARTQAPEVEELVRTYRDFCEQLPQRGGTTSAATFVLDLYDRSNNRKELKAGERVQLAKELKAQAWELKEVVRRFRDSHEQLRQDWKDLKAGEREELAKDLWAQAREVEELVRRYGDFCEQLQQRDWKDLKAGEREELAKDLWAQAQELEELVRRFSVSYEKLQQQKLL